MLTKVTRGILPRLTDRVTPKLRGVLSPIAASLGIFPRGESGDGVVITITADTNNVNMRTVFGNPAQAGTYTLYLKANIGSTSASNPSFTTGSGWAAGAKLRVKIFGDLDGRGGDGGVGGSATAGGSVSGGGTGGAGGDAIEALVPLKVWNFGRVRGGGGGGGGGGACAGVNGIGDCNGGGGGGGGGAGRANSNGGGAGSQSFASSGGNVNLSANPGAGNPGTSTNTGGTGGGGGAESAIGGRFSQGGGGGHGGDYGQAGTSGGAAGGVNDSSNIGGSGGGGAAGKATKTGSNTNITWMATGTIIGALG